MIGTLGANVVRLAYPMVTDALLALSDAEEQNELMALAARTAPIAANARGYIDRPFRIPMPSRFSDGSYGVLYAANSLLTAVRETAYHLEQIFSDGQVPESEHRRVRLALRLRGSVYNARRTENPTIDARIYDANRYVASQAFGREVRKFCDGIQYDSVRDPDGGVCVGAFHPRLVRSARIISTIGLIWNGDRFIEIHEIQAIN